MAVAPYRVARGEDRNVFWFTVSPGTSPARRRWLRIQKPAHSLCFEREALILLKQDREVPASPHHTHSVLSGSLLGRPRASAFCLRGWSSKPVSAVSVSLEHHCLPLQTVSSSSPLAWVEVWRRLLSQCSSSPLPPAH